MARLIRHRAALESVPSLNHLPALLARIYAARGVRDGAQVEHQLSHLLAPDSMKGLSRAAARLADALIADQSMLVIGDYDADGATSSALALLALRAMGARRVDFLVPNRFEYGYGLTPELVALAVQARPDLIMTVDNGIASNAGVAAANACGIDVVITDHHLPGALVPDAYVIVNPNQQGCQFPSKHLAGVGVVFYLMSALRGELRQRGWFEQRAIEAPNLAQFLDLVALGTVADLVPLDHNNRILVQQGLRRIRAGLTRPGLRALLELAGRSIGRVVSSDLGFAVAPRINASGRLDDIGLGIRCLLEESPDRARAMAAELDALNRERREIEAGMQQEAARVLDTWASVDQEGFPWGLCLFQTDWHQGVVGLVASRMKDRHHRPVIAFAPGVGGEIKGSARSVRGFHMRDALAAIDAAHPGLIERFGGHAMAAGLSLREQRFAEFASAFDAEVRRTVDAADLNHVLESDGELAAADFSLHNAELLREAAPWGQHFAEPLFDGQFLVHSQRIVGERHLRLVLSPRSSPTLVLAAIAFNVDCQAWPNHAAGCVHAAYRLDVNEYRGERQLQLLVEELQVVPASGQESIDAQT